MNGTRIHYWLGGNPLGQPVLLWHVSLGCGPQLAQGDALLAPAAYAVLVPDMRGYGDSDKPPGTEGYDARALAEEFRALVGQIEFGCGKRLLWAAHDMAARTTPSPKLDKEQQQQFLDKAKALAPKYKSELLKEA